MGIKTHEVCIVLRVRHIVLVLLFCHVCLRACPREKGNKQKSSRNVLTGNGGEWSRDYESGVLIRRSKQWMSVMHKYMQVQSYLCQLGVEDLKGIAKDLGCSHSEVEGKKVGKNW